MGVPKLIDADNVSRILDMTELIEVIENALGNFSKGEEDGGIVQPIRSVVPVKKHEGFLAVMPGYSENDEALATKVVTIFHKNKDIPSHNAVILLFNPTNGCLDAILDGDVITSMRTAAASAVSCKYLAPVNTKVLAILGSGVQARSHLKALTTMFSFTHVYLWNINRSSCERFGAEIARGDPRVVTRCGEVTVCDSVRECVTHADIIVTVTGATQPVLCGKWVKQGTHVCAVGAPRPNFRELDEDLMQNAVVYVDSYAGGEQEAGDIIMNKATIYAELGEVINGMKIGDRGKTSVFKSLGMAVEDVVSAKLVYNRLMAEGAAMNTSKI